MNRLLGNRGKPADEDVSNDYNECVAEIKKENPYIGHLALQHEAMKRVAQRRAAKQDSIQNAKEDFAPQRIAFRRRSDNNKNAKNKESNNSSNQLLSRSFIGFLSSSTKTEKISNQKVVAASHENRNNFVMAGRRSSTYFDEDHAVHTAAYAMRDIELSDSEEDDISEGKSRDSRRSTLSKKLSSLRGNLTRKQSASQRRASTNSSISTLQRRSSDSSTDSTIEKSVDWLTADDNVKPQHNPQLNRHDANECGEKKKEEEEEDIMDFVEEFLAKGGSVHPARTEKLAKVSSRRASLFSVEENKTCGESASKSIASLGEPDGSLIVGWGRGSLNESELMGQDGDDLICAWASQRSLLSNSSAISHADLSSERKKFPREINVGSNPSRR